MVNLLKNVTRSFKKNKLSICGLTFLVFLSVGIYTTLSGTTSAINKEYKRILKDGNLHDFTISELYNVGVVRYSNTIEKFKDANGEDVYSCLYNDNLLSKIKIEGTDETIIAPYVTVTGVRNKANVSITYTVDISNCDDNASLKSFYLDSWTNHLRNPSSTDIWTNHIEYLQPTISYQNIRLDENAFTYFTESQKRYGKNNFNDYVELSKDNYDSYYNALQINNNTQNDLLTFANGLYSIVGQENTLMSQYLSNLSGVSEFRNFTSLNIDNSSDNIYYKVIKSNPTDTVDSLVSIDPNNGVNKTQWNNFDVKDCTFNVLDFNSNDNWSLNQTLRYIPDEITDGFDIHYIEKIYLLSKGAWTQIPNEFQKIINNSPIPTNNNEARQNWWDSKKTLLNNWLKYENTNQEQPYCKDDRVTIQWTSSLGNPIAWSINNWTSHFAVVNPEFLKENNLHTLDPSAYNQIESYKQYVNNNPSITDQKMRFIGWINSTNYPDFENWFESIYQNPKYKNQFIIPGGASPHLIIGSGITPDFIYPITSMERLTPNPKKECIYFVNDAGYSRIFDSFRNNLNENYIVGKFTSNNKKIQQETLDNINQYAANKMIYPKGIKAAYFATDMNNVLNTSSFRISYIPKFINIINLTSISLTLFIIFLSLVICGIVIHRYITNQQSILGIMRANGFSTKQIATSMLPFAMTPTIIGTLLGVIIGTLLQLTVLGLFSNYWMLPTKLLGFNWIGFVVILFITLAIFISTVYFTSLYVLRKNTVDLMKNDSQNNPNFTSRSIKRIFCKFGIMTKFRTSVAFNSIWKLIVLVIMTSLSLSTLMFTFSISGKFKIATSLTNKSRDYNYAIDLITPTIQGGQYVGVNFDKTNNNSFGFAGVSGFNQAGNDSRDVNYVQSLYYGDCSETNMTITGSIPFFGPKVSNLTLPGIEYGTNKSGFRRGYLPKKEDSEGNEHYLNFFLNKKYYFSSMIANYLNVTTSASINVDTEGVNNYLEKYYESMMSSSQDSQDTLFHSNLFIPFMGDSYGQQADIFYLKDRMLTNSTLNYFLGSLGMGSNPWDIAASLMPDNNKKLLEKASADFVNFIGNAIYYEDGKSDISYKELHDLFVMNIKDENLLLYKEFIKPAPSDLTQYIINTNIAVGDNQNPSSEQSTFNVAIRPTFLNLLSTAYAYIECGNKDYYVTYNTIPMLKEDETYTWIDGHATSDNAPVKIIGIKTGEQASKFINLFDEYKNNLNDGNNSLIRYTQEQFRNDYKLPNGSWNYNFNKPFPIIPNAYAAHKYNLKVGSEISFSINNRIDRYLDEINGSSPTKHVVKFKVVGICTTYEGQEYYIDQDVANLLLGLKTHLWDGEYDRDQYIQSKYQPNNYYSYEYETLDNLLDFSIPYAGKGINVPGGNDMLINLNDYEDQMYGSGYNLTPYGFNGVFTKSMNGNPILTKCVVLYSTTGLYPGNDKLTSEVTTQLLSYGANLELLRCITLNGDLSNELSIKINNAYTNWIDSSKNEKEQKHKILESMASEAVNFIHEYFGDQAYTLVVANVSDALSSQLIYDNLSSTISNITYAVIAVISLMVIIIVALITNMVINDSKRLASLLKALGYTDGENASSFLAIYVPVIIFSLAISLLLSWGLIAIYNSLIFNGMSIWLNTQIKWYNYLISTALVSVVFGLSGLNSAMLLKHTSLVDSIK